MIITRILDKIIILLLIISKYLNIIIISIERARERESNESRVLLENIIIRRRRMQFAIAAKYRGMKYYF